ncbi:MAG: hypothetical protein ACI81W_003661 [Saprospiraceae bacterium]|jgi:hypothetical protein
MLSTYAQNLQNNIPKDATFVITINPGVLNSKVKFDKLKEFDFFKMGMEEMTKQAGPMAGELKKFINDPSEFGMDMMSSSYAFGKIDGKNIHMGFVLKVADKSKFDEIIQTYVAPMMPVQKANNMEYISADGVNLSWNSNQIVISSVELDYEGEEEYEAHKERKEKAATDWMNSIMAGSITNSISAHPKFKLANVNQDDINFWSDYASLAEITNDMQGAGMNPMAQMVQEMTKGMYQDSYISMGLNFNKGATRLNSRYFMNKEMTDIYSKISDVSYNKKFLQYIPKNNLGYFSFNYNLKNLVDIIKASDNEMLSQLPIYESMAVEGLKGIGLDMTADDIYNLWKGDALLVVTGMKEFEKEVTTYEYDDDFNKTEVKKMKKEQLPEFVFMMSHGSKDNILKIIDLGKQSSMISEKKGFFQVSVPDMPMDVYMKVEKDMILVSNKMDVVTKKAKKVFKKKSLINPKEALKIMNSTQRIYWNIPKTMDVVAAMDNMNMDGPEGMMLNMSKDSFESMVFEMNKKVGSSVDGDFILNFNNKDINSMEQIFNMINEAFSTMMGGSSM